MKAVGLIICLLPTLILSETFRQHYRQNGDRAQALNFIDQYAYQPIQDGDSFNVKVRGNMANGYQQQQESSSQQQSQSAEWNIQENRRINQQEKQQSDSEDRFSRQKNQVNPVKQQTKQSLRYSSEVQHPKARSLYLAVNQQLQQSDSSSQERAVSGKLRSQESLTHEYTMVNTKRQQDWSPEQQKSSRKLIKNKHQLGSSSQQQISSEQQDSRQETMENSDSSSQQHTSSERLNLKSQKRSSVLPHRNSILQNDGPLTRERISSEENTIENKSSQQQLDYKSKTSKQQRFSYEQDESSQQQSSSEQDLSTEDKKNTRESTSSQQDSSSQEKDTSSKQKFRKRIVSPKLHSIYKQQEDESFQQRSEEQDASTQQSSFFNQKKSRQQKDSKHSKSTSSQQDSSSQEKNTSSKQSSQQNSKLQWGPMKSNKKHESSENIINHSHERSSSQDSQNWRYHHHQHNKRQRQNEDSLEYGQQRYSNKQRSTEENNDKSYEQYSQKQKLSDKRKIKQGSPSMSRDQSSEVQNDYIPNYNMKTGKKARLQMEEILNINTEVYRDMPQLTEEQKSKFMSEMYIAEKENKEPRNLNATGMLRENGYPVENHKVNTKDGYILKMVRIPAQQGNAPVVFLMHGLLGSADDWLLMGPKKSLAYMLSDAGYDVWLGNARGNKYSQNHVTKQPAMPSFWEYSVDEIAQQDLPAMIDYILQETQQEQLNYVGHSLGATVFFAMAATKPEYNEKIIKMFALSPMAYMSNVRSPVMQMIAPNKPLELLEDGEFKPTMKWIKAAGGVTLKKVIGSYEVASNVYFIMAGVNMKHMNATKMPVILAHLPAGASVRQMKHLGQAVASGEFGHFDYGIIVNEQVYGSPVPPRYLMKKVTAPVALYYSEQDWLANPMDVEKLKNELPNVIEAYKVPVTEFTSTDFLFGVPARDVINRKLIASIVM